MLKRKRRYRCPACKKTMLRVAATKTVKSYCEEKGRDVRLRLAPVRSKRCEECGDTAVDVNCPECGLPVCVSCDWHGLHHCPSHKPDSPQG